MVKFFKRLEGFIILALAIAVYAIYDFNWLYFVLAFFVPDITAIFLLIYRRFGYWLYQLFHSYYIPSFAIIAGLILKKYLPTLVDEQIVTYIIMGGFIWAAHIAFDHLFAIEPRKEKLTY